MPELENLYPGDQVDLGDFAEIERLRVIVEMARLVRAMQKRYFETRDRNALVECKQLERRLDELLK